MDSLNQHAVENFCEYLRIATVHPNPDYSRAVEFLKDQSKELQLEFSVHEVAPSNPVVIMKWNGLNPTWQSVVLSSHMDVVPVFPNEWKYPPFSAHIDDEGNIYARGSQDMKCVGSQYLEAIRRIKSRIPNYIPERNIFVIFVPDEEIGGKNGMKLFVETDVFREMNIGLVMDEGLASETDIYPAFYGDRLIWWVTVIISGNTGHGSQFIDNTAGEKTRMILDKFMDFRDQEQARMKKNKLFLGDVTTVNLTGTTGGIQHNVIPSPFTLDFDIRITPSQDITELRQMFAKWAEDVGGGVEYVFKHHMKKAHLTKTDSSNKWWMQFQSVCQSNGMEIVPQVFPASTDGRLIRKKGIPVIGFSPMNRTPILLHDHNEFLNVKTFIRGIDFYEKLIPSLAAVAEE